MGTSSSSLCQLPTNDYLQRLSSPEPITANDPFWNQLLSFTFLPPTSSSDARLLEEQTADLLANFRTNNLSSCNLASFTQVLRLRLEQLLQMDFSQPQSGDFFFLQTNNALFILRSLLKHLVENESDDKVVAHFCAKDSPNSGAEALELLLVAVVTTLVDVPVTPDSYSLHLEAINLLLVLLSAQLYCGLTAEGLTASRLLLQGSCSVHAAFLTRRLLRHFTDRRPTPPQLIGDDASATDASLLSNVATTFWSVVTLGYGGRSSSSSQSGSRLADQSLLLLLILVNHSGTVAGKNPFRQALFSFTDATQTETESSESSEESSDEEEEARIAAKAPSSFSFDLPALHSALSCRLDEDAPTVLFYLLMHRNAAFRRHVTQRKDIEDVVLPILQTLYKSPSENSHHIYMSLIVLLMLTEDDHFNENVHEIMLQSVTWTVEHPFSELSLGSLLVYVLVRTIQHNLQHLRDKYLHTNCLAALANMAAKVHKLEPYVSQRLVNLVCHLAKRHVRTVEKIRIAATAPSVEADGGLGRAEHEFLQDLSVLEEVVRYVLEILNAILSHCLVSNPHLIYNLLHRRESLEPFRTHPSFQDVMQNIDLVLGFFLSKLKEQNASKENSEQWVMAVVQEHVRSIRREHLKKFPELKFKYVEEESPEEFFVPYLWSLVYQRSRLFFSPAKIRLFRLQATGEATTAPNSSLV